MEATATAVQHGGSSHDRAHYVNKLPTLQLSLIAHGLLVILMILMHHGSRQCVFVVGKNSATAGQCLLGMGRYGAL